MSKELTTHEETPRIVRAVPGPMARPQGSAQGAPQGVTAKDVFRALRKRVWLVLLVLIFFTGLAVGGTFLWQRMAPLYESYALVEVHPPEVSALRQSRIPQSKDIMDRILATRATILKSETVLRKATEDPDLQKTPWYAKTPKDELVEEMEETVTINAVPESSLLRIGAKVGDPTSAQALVNAVAQAGVTHGREIGSSERRGDVARLEEERDSLQGELDKIREDIIERRKSIEIGNFEQRFNALTLQLQDIVPRRTQLEIERDRARQELTYLEQQQQAGMMRSAPEVIQMLNMDPQLNQLRAAQLNITTELDNLTRKYGPRHRMVQSAATRLETIESQIAQAERRIIETQAQSLIQMKRQELETIVHELNRVGEKYEQVNSQLKSIRESLDQVGERQAQKDVIEDSIERIESKILEERLIARGARPLTLAQSGVIRPGISFPRFSVFVPAGVLLGLAIGVGLALLLELVDTSIRNPADVGNRVDLPLLGMVPHEDDLEEDVGELATATLHHPASMVGEAFRQIRTNLLFSGLAEQRRSLMVTSPSPEDGRTTVATNMGTALAQGGRRVLLIDANFRQPSIGRLFPQCQPGGLSSALVGQENWRDMVSEVGENLSAMAAGPLPPNPADLLSSKQLRQVLGEMTEEYDQVIFDGPPCMVVTDASVLAAEVDGVVLVIRANSNTFGLITRTKDSLQKTGGRILGAVLNGVRATAGGYLRKNYEAFYDYHEQQKLTSK